MQTFLQSSFQSLLKSRLQQPHPSLGSLGSFGKARSLLLQALQALACSSVILLGASAVHAAPPDTAPTTLKTALNQIEAAANRQDLEGVMGFYDEAFIHLDGFNRETLKEALADLWETYPELTYRTELNAWEQEGDALIAETTTYITGQQVAAARDLSLEAKIQSRQRFEGGKLVQQEILSEESRLTSGDNPPTVDVQLPLEVAEGESFNFDAIVEEPLGERLLLGAAVDESVSASNYFNPTEVELELLSSGGLFKLGRAPLLPEDQWISAVLIREDGLTFITQRVRIQGEQ